MQQTNSTAFSRTLAFTRSQARNGLFNWPTITYILRESELGPEIARLQMRGRAASFIAAIPSESFNLKKGFWGNRWLYTGDGEREFGRIGFGWNFLPSFTFADGSRYYLRAKRRWPFGSKPGKPSQTASFLHDDMEVMLLQNVKPMAFFSNETTVSMEGTIGSNIAEPRIIAGLLLFYQSHLAQRNKRAH